MERKDKSIESEEGLKGEWRREKKKENKEDREEGAATGLTGVGVVVPVGSHVAVAVLVA